MKTIADDATTGSSAHASGYRWRMLAALCAALFSTAAHAGEATGDASPQVWINPGIYSQHFDSGKGLRNNNVGFGAEFLPRNDRAFMAGSFINSNRAKSRYAACAWRPLHWQFAGINAGAGIAVGAFDGYPNYRNGGWFVAPLPLLYIEGRYVGANISVIPTLSNRLDGAVAVQIKFRVW